MAPNEVKRMYDWFLLHDMKVRINEDGEPRHIWRNEGEWEFGFRGWPHREFLMRYTVNR